MDSRRWPWCLLLCGLFVSPVSAKPAPAVPAAPSVRPKASASAAVVGQTALFDQSTFVTDNSNDISTLLSANDFVLVTERTVGGFSVWLTDDDVNDNGVLDSFSGTLGWGIYSDNAGAPGTLLHSGQDSAAKITDTEVQDAFDADIAQVDVTFPAAIELPAGTYWLALQEGAWGSAYDGTTVWWQWTAGIFGNTPLDGSPISGPVWAPAMSAVDVAMAFWGANPWDHGTLDVANSDDISTQSVANDFAFRSARYVTGLTVFLTDDAVNDNGVLDSFSGTLSYFLYQDNAGEPGAPLTFGQATPLLVDTGLQDDFDADIVRAEVALSTPLAIPAGTYWLALVEGSLGSSYDGTTVWWQWAAATPVLAGTFQGPPGPGPTTWTSTGSSQETAFVWWGEAAWDQGTLSLENSNNITTLATANDFNLPDARTLYGFSAWLSDDEVNDNGVLDSFSDTLGWAIYTDNGGMPGTLIASGEDSSPLQIDTGAQDDFDADILRVDVVFPSALTLPPGTYWLALHEGTWGSAADGSNIWWEFAAANVLSGAMEGNPETGPTTWTPFGGPDDNAFVMWDALSDLGITKTDGVLTAIAGQTVTYTITVQNFGPDPEPLATVSDTFPAALTCSTTSVAAGGASGNLPGPIAGSFNDNGLVLPVGSSVTYTAVCSIAPGATGTIANTATVFGAGQDLEPTNNSATDTDTLTASADVSISKTDGTATATPGSSVTYTIVASNAGPSTASGVTVADTFAAILSGCSTTSVAAGGATGNDAGPVAGSFSDSGISLPVGGTVTYTASCTIDPAATGSLVNTATISASTSDPASGNNSATDTDTLTASADVSITKTDGVTSATPGSPVTYTIVANNAGPSTATGVTVADTFAAILSGCSTTSIAAGGATGNDAGPVAGSFADSGITLPVGASVTYTATCTIDPAATGSLVNTATISAATTDPASGNNSATDTDTLTASADVSISKTDGVISATPGTSVTYTIIASNAGPSTATGVTVADTFAAILTGCSTTSVAAGGATGNDAGPVSGSFSDSGITLPVGGTVTYTATCTIDPAATGSLVNTATISAVTTDPASGNNSATDTDTLTASADVSITKTDGVTSATPGTSVTYTIVASNAGPSTATGVTVADTFAAILTGCSTISVAAGGATGNDAGPVAGSFSDSGITLPGGGTVTYTATCTIDPAATGSLVNTATISAVTTDPASGNNSATDTDTLGASADVSITKTDGVTAATPGSPVTYTLVASNAGPSTATGVTVADTFAAILTGCSTTSVAAGGATGNDAGPVAGSFSDSGITLPVGGTVTYTATCTIDPAATGSLVNTATISAVTTDPASGNNSATDTDTLGASADVSITKTDGVTAATPGSPVTYTIVASNAGPSTATGVTVADTFAAILTGCSTTSLAAGGATGNDAGPVAGSFSDSGITLPVGATVTYSATCTIDPAATGSLVNTATITAATTDPTSGNNSATDTDTLGASADVSITKTDGVTAATPGSPVTYTIVASNAGPSTATGVTVADTFAAILTGCSTTSVATGGATGNDAGPVAGSFSDSGITLPVGASVTYTATCTIDPAATGSLVNTATITAATTDPASGNNSATDSDTLGASADVSITKTDGVTAATPGSPVTYTLVASNAGPSAATGVTVADTFVAILTGCSTTSVAAGGATGNDAGPVAGSFSDSGITLPVGASVTYTATCTIDPAATGSLVNTATITAVTTDPASGNNSATDTDTLGASADVSITKTDGVTAATPGSPVTYTLVASNAGPSTATGVTVADTFVAILTGCSTTSVAAGGATGNDAGPVAGSFSDSGITLPVGGTVTYTATCTIDPAATGSLVNTATITADTVDPATGNNSATDTDTLGATADLDVSLSAEPTSPQNGDVLTYTVLVFNHGPSAATGAQLQIVLAPGLSAVTTSGCLEDPNGVPTCSLPPLAAGETATVTVSGIVDAQVGDSLITTITAVLAADPNSANNTASLEVLVNGSVVEVPTQGNISQFLLAATLLALGLFSLARNRT